MLEKKFDNFGREVLGIVRERLLMGDTGTIIYNDIDLINAVIKSEPIKLYIESIIQNKVNGMLSSTSVADSIERKKRDKAFKDSIDRSAEQRRLSILLTEITCFLREIVPRNGYLPDRFEDSLDSSYWSGFFGNMNTTYSTEERVVPILKKLVERNIVDTSKRKVDGKVKPVYWLNVEILRD